MGGKKPRGRGVLANLLRMGGGEKETPTESTAPQEAEQPAGPAPLDDTNGGPVGDTHPSGYDVSERESYEPGWYRISLAQPAAESSEEEWTEEVEPVRPAAPVWGEEPPSETPAAGSADESSWLRSPPAGESSVESQGDLQGPEPTTWHEPSESDVPQAQTWQELLPQTAASDPYEGETTDQGPAETAPEDPNLPSIGGVAGGYAADASAEAEDELLPRQDDRAVEEPAASPSWESPTLPEAEQPVVGGFEAPDHPEFEAAPWGDEPAASEPGASEQQEKIIPPSEAWRSYEESDGPEEESPAAPRPAGVREAYEPSWYRITLAQSGAAAARESSEPAQDRGSHGVPGPKAEPEEEPVPKRWTFSRRRSKEEETPAPVADVDPEIPVFAKTESEAPTPEPFQAAEVQAVDQPPGETVEPVRAPESAEAAEVRPDPPSVMYEPSPDVEAVYTAPPVETPEVAGPVPTPSPELAPSDPSLVSLAAKDRRSALEQLKNRGLSEADVASVSALVSDPERDIRALAVETLMQRAQLVELDVVRRGLQDPADEVRSATVRLSAARSDPDLVVLGPLVAARRWPLTQQTAHEVLPDLISSSGMDDQSLGVLLSAVTGMESSPVGDERAGFVALATAIGRDRLIASIDLPDDRRLGVVRLLLEDGSPEALRAVAERSQDPLDEVRIAATAAKDHLTATEPEPEPEPEPVQEPEPQPEPEPEPELVEFKEPDAERPAPPVPDASTEDAVAAPVEAEIISGIARALEDPDEGVRERATRALGEVDRSSLLSWTRQALQSGDPVEASLAGGVAEAGALHEVAGDVLDRAAALRPESRGSLVGALSSLGLEDRELVALASSVDVAHRPDAVRLLWQVAGRRVLPPLRTMLEDSSGQVRVAVLEVFGESGDPSAIEVAHSVLEHDSSPVVRATAIQVIGRAGLDQRTASLAQALDDPDPDVRSTAVELLPQGMAGQASELLLKALQDDDDRVWQPAMRHLVSLPKRNIPVLWKAVKEAGQDRRGELVSLLERTSHERLALVALDHLSSPDHDDRTLAISLASRSGTQEAVQGIIGTLVDPLPAVRRAGAAALAQMRTPEAIPALAQALNDPNSGVRVEALRTLSVIDDERVLDPLINAMKDPETNVRDVASEGLIRWSSPAVARRLVEALTSPVLRRPASELLARMGTSAVDPLINLLREGHPEIAATVGETLEQLVGRDMFLERLGSLDSAERLGAVEALGSMGGLESVEGLIGALSDPNEEIRIRSLRLLGDLGDRRACEAVERAAHGDPVPEVAAAADEALRRLQGS